jgi:hypothetical protein
MPPVALFGLSIAFSFVAWGLFTAYAVWPALRERAFADAMRPLLILHSFRFVGLSFLIPGVVCGDLPANFTFDAAYGDIVATVLALAALASLRTSFAIPLLWIFNVWGAADLLNAFYQANAGGIMFGHLGAAYFIPTVIVPFALITHGLMFRLLLRRSHRQSTRYATPHPPAVGV